MSNVFEKLLEKYDTSTPQKAENAIREILQEVALVGLWRAKLFESCAFYGGTALRILYGLDRYSEDLDFTLLSKNKSFSWKAYTDAIVSEMSAYGFEVDFSEKIKSKTTPIKSAFLKTSTYENLLKVSLPKLSLKGLHPEKQIRIKLEIDTDPTLGFETEVLYIDEPLPIGVKTLVAPDLFAGKMHAALYRTWKKRVKGRDWYDLIWYLRKQIPLNLGYLSKLMHEQGNLAPSKELDESSFFELFDQNLSQLNIEQAKQDIAPFITDKHLLDLWSLDYFRKQIRKIKFTPKVSQK